MSHVIPFSAQLFLNAAMGADHRSDDSADVACLKYGKPVPADQFETGSFHVEWTGADQVDATVQLQVSDDPAMTDASFQNKTGFVVTLAAAAGNAEISVDSGRLTERWARLKYAHGTNTTGTMQAFAELKG